MRDNRNVGALGPNILWARQYRLWSLRELSRRTGIAITYLGQLERGEYCNPGLQRLLAIAQAFRCPIDALLTDGGDVTSGHKEDR